MSLCCACLTCASAKIDILLGTFTYFLDDVHHSLTLSIRPCMVQKLLHGGSEERLRLGYVNEAMLSLGSHQECRPDWRTLDRLLSDTEDFQHLEVSATPAIPTFLHLLPLLRRSKKASFSTRVDKVKAGQIANVLKLHLVGHKHEVLGNELCKYDCSFQLPSPMEPRDYPPLFPSPPLIGTPSSISSPSLSILDPLISL